MAPLDLQPEPVSALAPVLATGSSAARSDLQRLREWRRASRARVTVLPDRG